MTEQTYEGMKFQPTLEKVNAPNTGKYGPEISPDLHTFHAVLFNLHVASITFPVAENVCNIALLLITTDLFSLIIAFKVLCI